MIIIDNDDEDEILTGFKWSHVDCEKTCFETLVNLMHMTL